MEPAELLTPTVDKSKVPPLHQKRIVAFINHFLISSCTFLNDFAANSEQKFIELERKIQRLEASLTIIEAKLASIPDDVAVASTNSTVENSTTASTATSNEANITNEQSIAETKVPTPPLQPPEEQLVRACEDVRYKKFFRMIQFGVHPEAVKLKMQSEGVDPAILDTPNLGLPDGTIS